MVNPEEFDNFEPFPVSPRMPSSSVNSGNQEIPVEEKLPLRRHFTPVNPAKVEYWNQGEGAKTRKTEKAFRRKPHAKRADQFGMLLMVCSLVVLVIVLGSIYMNNKKYSFATSNPVEKTSAVVDFYQGNHVFFEKVAEEKAAKQQNKGHEVHGISSVNDDLEVSLSDQMSSMSEKMKKMRSEQQADEAPPPTPDTGFKNEPVQIKPTKSENFQAPEELDKTLPKALQNTN